MVLWLPLALFKERTTISPVIWVQPTAISDSEEECGNSESSHNLDGVDSDRATIFQQLFHGDTNPRTWDILLEAMKINQRMTLSGVLDLCFCVWLLYSIKFYLAFMGLFSLYSSDSLLNMSFMSASFDSHGYALTSQLGGLFIRWMYPQIFAWYCSIISLKWVRPRSCTISS